MDLKSTLPREDALSIFSMFTRPLATLASLRERPHWLYPVLLSGIFSVAANFYVIQRVGFLRLLDAAAHASAAIEPQRVLQNAQTHQTMILSFQALSTFVSIILVALVVAKVLWLLLTLLGHDIVYKKILAVVAHAGMLPAILRECMLVLTTTIMRDPNAFDLGNPLATNPAFFIRSGSPLVSRLLASLDAFTFINIVLIIVGLNRVCSHLSMRSASLTVVIPWTVYVGATLLMSTWTPA